MTEGGQWQQGQPPEWQPAQPQYAQPQYGQPPYGQPGYGYAPAYAPGWPQQPPVWPHGPGRPGLATASAVLGIVTGSLTVLGGLVFLVAGLTDDGDPSTWLLSLGVPVGVALLVGGIGLLGRRRAALVLWSAVAAAVLLLASLVAGLAWYSDDEDAVQALLGFTVFAWVLPVVTASLAAQRVVREWAASDPAPRW
ncbi:hypothetical protein [Modestobacter versicolor]|uniref:Uncharacterized protein n=1 Tax=Modestobacter versicolor TaxID=429133 RepID=A0A323VG44_9ACTN|nr:hypothetical protein [Modestobacter versicolor]MBB3677407.1 hypothetical protein [Modestobacter versicolor]PZA22226.1 hypothetical protein DMO24_06220 [Modestobacter versicolor]